MNLIDKYKNIIAKDKYDIGTVKDYEARIDLIIDKYCSKRPRIDAQLKIKKKSKHKFQNYSKET